MKKHTINDYLTLTNEDNMQMMARYPDNYFDLGIIDCEYGIGASKQSKKPNKVKQRNGKILDVKTKGYRQKDWDNSTPSKRFFDEIKRVTKHQIVWGVNYYDYDFSGGRIVWDKLNKDNDQFGCEIAYCSLNKRTDIIYYLWSGMMQVLTVSKDVKKALVQRGDKSLNETRIHPTQKPIPLNVWLLKKYAQSGYKILDTNTGSGTLAIAVDEVNKIDNMKLEFFGCEIDSEMFDDSIDFIHDHTRWIPSVIEEFELAEQLKLI